jgi:hypothetical protein
MQSVFCQPKFRQQLKKFTLTKNVSKHDKQKTPELSCGNKKESGRFRVLEAALFSRGLGTY